MDRRAFLEVMGSAIFIGYFGSLMQPTGCVSTRITPIPTTRVYETREELHQRLKRDFLAVDSAQEFLEKTQDYRGPIVVLTDSPVLNNGHEMAQIYEWGAMTHFTKLRDSVGDIQAYNNPILWMYFDLHEDSRQSELSGLFETDQFGYIERPQVVVIGGGSSPIVDRRLDSRVLRLRIKDIPATVRRDALWVERKILGEE